MSACWYHLSRAVCLNVSGKDARRYLNNRLSNDLRALPPGQSLRAAALSPQGRVEGLFTVFLNSEERFYLVSDGGNRQALLASVGRYIVADRVSIEDITSTATVIHVGLSVERVQERLAIGKEQDVYMRAHARIGREGTDILILGDDSAETCRQCAASFGGQLSSERYDLLRCKWGTPVFPLEVNEQAVLTECGLRDAVSFSKGCYVGQEVIERSDAIGKLPRSLERVVLSGIDAPREGTPVHNSSNEAIGKLVSVMVDSESQHIYAFALLRTGKYSTGEVIRCDGLEGTVLKAEPVTI